MIDIDVRINDDELRRQLRGVREDIIDRATVSSLNKAAGKVRTAAGREIRKSLPLPARSVTRRFKVIKAKRGAMVATLRARDYDPPLSMFRPLWRQGKPGGASVRLPGRGLQIVEGSFVARTSYGRPGVFKRKGKKRGPLKFLRASDAGLPTIGGAIEIARRMLNTLGVAEFRKEFERQLRSRFGVLRG